MKHKILTSAIAVFLAAVLLLNHFSKYFVQAAEKDQYIESIQLFTADTKAEAIKKCQNSGYMYADADLNEGNDSKAVVLGYTITDDPDKAITDISVLEMNSGYDTLSYADIRDKEMEKASGITSAFMASIKEYRENLEAGSPAAIEANRILNLYTIPEMGNAALGDYLAGDSVKEDFIKKIVCQASMGVVMTMFNCINSGVADFGETNWAQRTCTSKVKENLGNSDYFDQYDREYKDEAMELRNALRTFYEVVTKARTFVDLYGMDVLMEEGKDAEAGEIPDDVLYAAAYGESFEDKDQYLLYLSAYTILSQYQYDELTTLADRMMMLGSTDIATTEQLRNLYPIADGMTHGQIGTVRLLGIPQLAAALANDAQLIQDAETFTAEMREKIRDAYKDGTEQISVWSGIDRTIYDSKVALTSATKRSTHAAYDFSQLTQTDDDFGRTLKEIVSYTSLASAVIGVAYSIVTICANAGVIYAFGWSAWWGMEAVSVWGVCSTEVAASAGFTFSAVLGFIGCAVAVLFYAAMVVSLIVLIVQLVKAIVDLCAEDPDQLEYTADDIPIHLYDYVEMSVTSAYVKYDVARDADTGKGGDLNALSGLHFAGLYYTKNTKIGSPLKVNPDGPTFRVTKNDNYAPEGFKNICYISSTAAADMNAYGARRESPRLYLSYYTGNGITEAEQEPEINVPEAAEEITEQETPETKEQETPVTEAEEQKLYLASIMVSTQKSETAAKADLVNQGFTPIDVNLTENLAGSGGFSYLGYKTTKFEKDAIRDIRIMPRFFDADPEIIYGSGVYSKAGDSTAAGAAIYYTRAEEMGTPVYADLQVTDARSRAVFGYEPVNLFSGGPAYDLDNCDGGSASGNGLYTISRENWDKNQVYIYFHPTETFTSGTEYLGGFSIVTGSGTTDMSGDDIVSFGYQLGYDVMNVNLSEDYFIYGAQMTSSGHVNYQKTIRNIKTYIVTTSTYNPYRAIYDIKSYTAMPGTSSLSQFMTTGNGGYTSATVFCQYDEYMFGGTKATELSRGISLTNSYNAYSNYWPFDNDAVFDYYRQGAEDYESFSWGDKEKAQRLKNFYVAGKTIGKSPITEGYAGSFWAVASPEDREYCESNDRYPIVDLKTPNSAEPHNIAVGTEHPVYLYLRAQKPQEKTYISSISVGSWDRQNYIGKAQYEKMDEDLRKAYDPEADDYCVLAALPGATDEVILKNLAASYDSSKQSSPDNVPETCAYLAVSRTDKEVDAIRSIIKYKPENPDDAREQIKVAGIPYTRAGSDPIHDPTGDYYLYYSKNRGCAPGEPITSIDFSDVPLVKDCATALTAKEEDITGIISRGEVMREGKTAELKGYANETNYIHSKFETQKTYISDLYIGSGNSEKEAMVDLMNMGCNMFIPLDLNQDAGGKYVYLGYDRYYNDTYGIRDIVCTIGHAPEDSITINGLKYKRAIDRYRLKGDRSNSISFNNGTNGYSIYLYYSYQAPAGTAEPIMRLAAGEKDYIPDNEGQYVWEGILTTSGKRANMNEGVFLTDNGYNKDARLYLFANRLNNGVKDGAHLIYGSDASQMQYGELILK